MPVQVKAILAALAVLGCVGLGWTTATTRAENKRLSATVAGLQIDLAAEQSLRAAEHQVATRQAQRLAALSTKQREQNAKLETALRAAPAWAAEPVPDSIADALGLPVSASEGQPAK